MSLLNFIMISLALAGNWPVTVDAKRHRSVERISSCGRVVMSECWCLDEEPCHNKKPKPEDEIPIIDEDNLLTDHVVRNNIGRTNPNELKISGRNIEAIDRHAFDNFTHLTIVNLDNNKIIKLTPNVFSKLENLTDLYLGYNGLTTMKNAFAGLSNLKTLDLKANPLTEALDDNCFYGVPKTANIEIRSEDVRKIGTDAFGTESTVPPLSASSNTVDYKNVKSKSVHTRSADWGYLSAKICIENGTVQLLDLASDKTEGEGCNDAKYDSANFRLENSGIKKFAKGWYRLLDRKQVSYSISSINLDGNEIARVTTDLVNDLPSYITWLTLSNNKIERLDKGTFVHPTIFSLELNDNLISEIEDDTFNMPKLYQLYLQRNRLKNTKFATSLPPALSSLDLEHNEIEEITVDSLCNLKGLSYLNLDHNRITTLASQGLHGPSHLGSLILSYNNISTINPGAFEGIKIGALYLSNNNITSLDKGLFNGDDYIQTLSLANNNLQKIESKTFDLPNLNTLNLKANLISDIEKGAMKSLGELNELDISKNPISELKNGVLFGLKKAHGTYVLVSKQQIRLIQGGVFDDV